MEETNVLKILEKRTGRKICGRLEEGERWRIRTNKEIKKILQGTNVVKFIKSLRLRWCGHVERMRNQRMPKQIITDTVEGTRNRRRPRK
jgi:hypothetical protein